MSKPNQPRKIARDERAHRNRLLPPAGGSPRVEASGPRAPEPYFVVGGRERSGFRNAIAAVRAAHPGVEVWVATATGDIEYSGPSDFGMYLARPTPRKGRHVRAAEARG